jgi:hypothetical protein
MSAPEISGSAPRESRMLEEKGILEEGRSGRMKGGQYRIGG